jgi:hypothetical protein
LKEAGNKYRVEGEEVMLTFAILEENSPAVKLLKLISYPIKRRVD